MFVSKNIPERRWVQIETYTYKNNSLRKGFESISWGPQLAATIITIVNSGLQAKSVVVKP